jgi:hypothetical protein
MLSGVSSSGTSPFLIQLGDSGGIETSGYTGSCLQGTTATTSTAGLIILNGPIAADSYSGKTEITLLGSNNWVSSGLFSGGGNPRISANNKTLSDTLTQIRITTVNGTDTFDAGSINILYE